MDLTCRLNPQQWAALFAKLAIKKLTIDGGLLETLQCFSAGPITQSLEDLTIKDLELPPSELVHLYNLHRLRTLRLDCCFSPPLDDDMIASLVPPTPVLPALTMLFHRGMDDGQCDYVEQQGSSFEWMQQRRTQ